ncbi:MAG: MerR family transcriptional regulator [Spirochaetales bacterium]|nr:MerR family transcriptional regulator [Spirochaetales bacterium]
MYSIGEVSEITRISRDRLRNYEEKGILTPVKNPENRYREYSIDDIDTVLLIEFYRSIDLSIDSINEISKDSSLEEIKVLIDQKKQVVDNELRKLTRISENISGFLVDYKNIKDNLNKVIIRKMDDFQIYDELADFRSYKEYKKIHNSLKKHPDKPIIRKLTRKIVFDDNRITENKMIITGPVMDENKTTPGNICSPGNCLYTVREDSRKIGNLMENIQRAFLSFIQENGLAVTGTAFANILFITKEDGNIKSYLEIFLLLKK